MRKSTLVQLSLIFLLAGVGSYRAAFADDQKKGDDVFVDEGDGDFDSMPVPTSESSLKPAAKAEPKAEAKAEAKAEEPAAPAEQPKPDLHEAAAPAPVDVPEAAPVKEAPTEAAQSAAPNDAAPTETADKAPVAEPTAAQAAPQAPAAQPAPVEKAAAHEATPHHAKQASAGKHHLAKGFYAVTQGPCPMKRAPASDSEQMITVKASKKIWIEKVDSNWVRAFNKAGEPGYIETQCVDIAD